MFQREQIDEYVNNKGISCPMCRQSRLRPGGVSLVRIGGIYTRSVWCEHCGASWKEVYTLTNIVEIAS